ncbi:hypothetical protein FKM82_010579 [Ascaphus truei]
MDKDQHSHCVNCVSRRCMARPETGVTCDLIGCPHVCGAVFHSCKADEHRILCPLERVPCLNNGFGCPFIVTRNKLAEHLQICPASVVCCTMEWNRWPVSYADRKSYENLSKDVDEVEQLDMALALQDQRMLLESLKVATTMSKTEKRESQEQIAVKAVEGDKSLTNGISGDEDSYSALYQATVETTKSLAAALDILNNATRDIAMLNGILRDASCELNKNFQLAEQNGDSPGGRGISDSRNVDGYHVDFGTQTFSFPSAILATNTMVGDIASASACDHANPQLSNPSPFQTLGLDLVLECVARYQTKQRSMFTFVCGQLFRRDEFSSHFKNVHGDIHAGLNGWMEQRCPLAYYGCTYSQRRFCPSTQGSKIIHDRHLRSFGVQPNLSSQLESAQSSWLGPSVDHFSSLPYEVLQHIAGFLDGFSLCQLSRVSRLMRDVCASLLQARGMVVLLWEKRQYPNGSSSWQIKEKVWRFSTAFCTVREWKFADIVSMADHLKKCSYNTVEKREEAIPLPCMCVTRELTKDGRSLRSVLKPVL